MDRIGIRAIILNFEAFPSVEVDNNNPTAKIEKCKITVRFLMLRDLGFLRTK